MFFARFIAPKIREHKGERCRDAVNNLGFIEKMLRKKHSFSLDNVSKDLKISKGNLSEMGNGRRFSKETLFCQFYPPEVQ